MAELVGGLDEARGVAENTATFVDGASPAQVRAWDDGQRRLLEKARIGLARLQRMATTPPPTPATLPEELRARFYTRSGKPLAFLFPAGDVFDPAELPDYVEASRRVWPEATGFPVVFEKMSRNILNGFQMAVVVGALAVTLILLIDFRSLRDTALALLPLALGVIWMMGAMRLLGFDFNFANLVAVPLIIGVGIDNGVHVIQRMRLEGREGMARVLRHTGRAILIASLTTMIGFGSLVLSSHRGGRSLGAALLLGVGACLLTSTIVLPNLLVALGLVEE
jgi:hypothetical protein